MLQAFITIIYKDLGISDSGIGILVALFSLSTIIFILPAGYLSDKFFPRNILRFGILMLTAYILGLLYFNTLVPLIFISIIGGLSSATINITLTTSLYRNLTRYTEGSKLGLFSWSASIGYATGPLTSAFIMHHYTLNHMFITAILFSLVLLLCTTPISIEKTIISPRIKDYIKDYIKDMNSPCIYLLITSVAVVGLHLGAEHLSLSLFLKYRLGFNDRDIGWFYAFIGIWVGLISYIFGQIFDKSGKVLTFMIAGHMLSGSFQILTIFSTSFIDVLIIRCLHTIGDGISLLINSIFASILFKELRLGGNLSLVQVIRMSGIFISSLIGGILNDYYGYTINFIITGVISFLFAIILLINKRILNRAINQGEKGQASNI